MDRLLKLANLAFALTVPPVHAADAPAAAPQESGTSSSAKAWRQGEVLLRRGRYYCAGSSYTQCENSSERLRVLADPMDS